MVGVPSRGDNKQLPKIIHGNPAFVHFFWSALPDGSWHSCWWILPPPSKFFSVFIKLLEHKFGLCFVWVRELTMWAFLQIPILAWWQCGIFLRDMCQQSYSAQPRSGMEKHAVRPQFWAAKNLYYAGTPCLLCSCPKKNPTKPKELLVVWTSIFNCTVKKLYSKFSRICCSSPYLYSSHSPIAWFWMGFLTHGLLSRVLHLLLVSFLDRQLPRWIMSLLFCPSPVAYIRVREAFWKMLNAC